MTSGRSRITVALVKSRIPLSTKQLKQARTLQITRDVGTVTNHQVSCPWSTNKFKPKQNCHRANTGTKDAHDRTNMFPASDGARSGYRTHLLCTALGESIQPCMTRLSVNKDCTALYCTVLHCTALHCTALHCTALHCTALHCTALHCTALHCTVLYCTVL